MPRHFDPAAAPCPMPPACFVPKTTPERARHDLRHDHRRAEARQHHVRHDTEAETSSQSGGARPRPTDAELVLPAVQVDIAPARCRRRKTTRCAPGIPWTHGSPSDRRGKMEVGPRIAWWAVQGSNL